MSGPVLVTGANGCIGAWVIRRGSSPDGDDVLALDVGDRRPSACASSSTAASTPPDWSASACGHLGTSTALARAPSKSTRSKRVIHLAALQVPFARADPPARCGSQRRRHREPLPGREGLARRGASARLRVAPSRSTGPRAATPRRPCPTRTTASTSGRTRATHGCSGATTESRRSGCDRTWSTAVGRDQGLTSSPTVAMLHAAAGRGVHDPLRRQQPAALRRRCGGGPSSLLSRAEYAGATVAAHRRPGDPGMGEVVAAIERARSAPGARDVRRTSRCRSRPR